MLVIGLIFSVFGIGFFCWLIFTLAVNALPFLIGLTAGMAAFHSNAGVSGALFAGIVAGALTLVVGQIAFASVRQPILHTAIALLYAVPAAIAGYHAVLGLSRIGVPSLFWREIFAWIGAAFTGGTALAHVAVRPARSCAGRWERSGSTDVACGRIHERVGKRLVVVRLVIGTATGRSPVRERGNR